PVQINFIELLRDALDCAVELMVIHQRGMRLQSQRAEEERMACRAIESLSALETTVARSTERQPGVSSRVLERICQATASIIQSEKVQLANQMAQDGIDSERSAADERARASSALERLLRQHDLIGGTVGLNLELLADRMSYRGRVLCSGALGIDALLAIGLPAGH